MTAAQPMRRIVADLNQVTVARVERPEPGLCDALVRMNVTGVCGSDTHAVHGRHPVIPLPYHPVAGRDLVTAVHGLDDAAAAFADAASGEHVKVLITAANPRP
jgi:D-arabinose 1-dehydrogenase-like Zn-dependent alcohol dehydrogenase